MNQQIYKLADRTIGIQSMFPEIHNMCSDYRIADDMDPENDENRNKPDFTVSTDQSDIEFERDKSIRDDMAEGRRVRDYSGPYLETLAVYRKISEVMPFYDTFLFHGSAVAVNGEAFIFTAKSGTGKSTHTSLWREMLGSRAVMVNDDKPLIRVHPDGKADVYGTPWDGKHHLSSNICVPIKAICILERDAENSMCRISKSEALPMLLQQSYRPLDKEALGKTLALINRLNVRFYRLRCNMERAAAELSYNEMKEG